MKLIIIVGLLVVTIMAHEGAQSKSQQTSEPVPPSIADVAGAVQEKEANLLARKQEVQFKSADLERIRGLIAGGMVWEGWDMIPDETEHQIGFQENYGSYEKQDVLIVRFTLSPASDSETLVRFAIYASRYSRAEQMAMRTKMQVLKMLDGIAVKLGEVNHEKE